MGAALSLGAAGQLGYNSKCWGQSLFPVRLRAGDKPLTSWHSA